MPFFLKKYEKTFILTFWALLKCAHRFVDMGCRVWLVGMCEYAVGAKYRWLMGGCLRFVEKCVSLLVKFMIC